MSDIMLILSGLSQSVDKKTLGRLGCLVEGMLAMTTVSGLEAMRPSQFLRKA